MTAPVITDPWHGDTPLRATPVPSSDQRSSDRAAASAGTRTPRTPGPTPEPGRRPSTSDPSAPPPPASPAQNPRRSSCCTGQPRSWRSAGPIGPPPRANFDMRSFRTACPFAWLYASTNSTTKCWSRSPSSRLGNRKRTTRWTANASRPLTMRKFSSLLPKVQGGSSVVSLMASRGEVLVDPVRLVPLGPPRSLSPLLRLGRRLPRHPRARQTLDGRDEHDNKCDGGRRWSAR